jgi:multisubunit Na+/H+ antiporter MnhE subunit
MRKELKIGILAIGFFIILNHMVSVLELILGLLLGVALSFLIMAVLPEKIYTKLKSCKKKKRVV